MQRLSNMFRSLLTTTTDERTVSLDTEDIKALPQASYSVNGFYGFKRIGFLELLWMKFWTDASSLCFCHSVGIPVVKHESLDPDRMVLIRSTAMSDVHYWESQSVCVKTYKTGSTIHLAAREALLHHALRSVEGVPSLLMVCGKPPALLLSQFSSFTYYDLLRSPTGDLMFFRVMLQICNILRQIHERDYVYNNLRPENISIEVQSDSTTTVRLLELNNVTKITCRLSKTFQRNVGCIISNDFRDTEWCAPELKGNDNHGTVKSDAFSVATLLNRTFQVLEQQPRHIHTMQMGLDDDAGCRPLVSKYVRLLRMEIEYRGRVERGLPQQSFKGKSQKKSK